MAAAPAAPEKRPSPAASSTAIVLTTSRGPKKASSRPACSEYQARKAVGDIARHNGTSTHASASRAPAEMPSVATAESSIHQSQVTSPG
jgi:hypothetical protein